jgi:hypothetical protein
MNFIVTAIIIAVPLTYYLWLRYASCNLGRHKFGPWGPSYDDSNSTGWCGTRRQDATCELCGSETYRHV